VVISVATAVLLIPSNQNKVQHAPAAMHKPDASGADSKQPEGDTACSIEHKPGAF